MPQFSGEIEGYVTNFLRKNFWRVQASMEYEDAMQESHWLFLKLADRYSGDVTEPRHFMALFKQALFRHFADLSTMDTGVRSHVLDSQLGEDQDSEEYQGMINAVVGDLDNSGLLMIMLQQAPADISTVLSFFLMAPQELVDGAFASWRNSKKKREGGNKMLCSILGFPQGTDIQGKIYCYFGAT